MDVRNEIAHSSLEFQSLILYSVYDSPRPLFSLASALPFLVSYGPDLPQISCQQTIFAPLLLTLIAPKNRTQRRIHYIKSTL